MYKTLHRPLTGNPLEKIAPPPAAKDPITAWDAELATTQKPLNSSKIATNNIPMMTPTAAVKSPTTITSPNNNQNSLSHLRSMNLNEVSKSTMTTTTTTQQQHQPNYNPMNWTMTSPNGNQSANAWSSSNLSAGNNVMTSMYGGAPNYGEKKSLLQMTTPTNTMLAAAGANKQPLLQPMSKGNNGVGSSDRPASLSQQDILDFLS